MAKKTSKKSPAEKTTTYSTRLNDEQKALVEEAAAIAGVSASKFIRDAALQAALDGVNAYGTNDAAILASMLSLADVLKKPHATITFHSNVVEHSTERTIAIGHSGTPLTLPISDDKGEDLDFRPVAIRANTLTHDQLKTLREIAVNCPISFSNAFRRAIDGANHERPQFVPKAKSQAILDD